MKLQLVTFTQLSFSSVYNSHSKLLQGRHTVNCSTLIRNALDDVGDKSAADFIPVPVSASELAQSHSS